MSPDRRPLVGLPPLLGDSVLALLALEPCWPAIRIRHRRAIVRDLCAILGIAIGDGRADYHLSHDDRPGRLHTVEDIVARCHVGHAWTRPALGAGVVVCPNASRADKEWPQWSAVADLGARVDSEHPDPLGAILGARVVVANHSGLAHVGCLLGRRVVCLQDRAYPIDPAGALMLGGEAGWPDVAAVRAAVASLT